MFQSFWTIIRLVYKNFYFQFLYRGLMMVQEDWNMLIVHKYIVLWNGNLTDYLLINKDWTHTSSTPYVLMTYSETTLLYLAELESDMSMCTTAYSPWMKATLVKLLWSQVQILQDRQNPDWNSLYPYLKLSSTGCPACCQVEQLIVSQVGQTLCPANYSATVQNKNLLHLLKHHNI